MSSRSPYLPTDGATTAKSLTQTVPSFDKLLQNYILQRQTKDIRAINMNMRLPDYLQDEIHEEDQLPHLNVDIPVDYSEYVWMGEEELEDFDRQVEEEFWEEAFLEACFEEMLEEEEAEWQHFTSSVSPSLSSKPCDIKGHLASKLNPNAPEFVPLSARKAKA